MAWRRRSRLDQACGRQGSSAVSCSCTTRLENAHGTEFREVLYRWHPWFGLRVAVHETVSRSDGLVFRCTLSGGGGRQLELPAWMFDRAACRDCFPLVTTPHVSVAALCKLSELVRDAPRRRTSASTTSPGGPSCASRNDDGGEARVSQPNEGIERPPQQATTARPVRREPVAVGRQCADLVRPSGRGEKRADRPDETTASGARGSRTAERGSGGRP